MAPIASANESKIGLARELSPITASSCSTAMPLDRIASSCSPSASGEVRRGQEASALSDVDAVAVRLYARGLTTGEISAHFAEMYGASVSTRLWACAGPS